MLVVALLKTVFLFQVIANVFFSGNLTAIWHVTFTVIVVAAATSISLVYDCLGIVLELNVSAPNNSVCLSTA